MEHRERKRYAYIWLDDNMSNWKVIEHARSVKSIETFVGRTNDGYIHIVYFFENCRTLKGLEMVVGKGTNIRLIDQEEYNVVVDKIQALPKWEELSDDDKGEELKARDLPKNIERRQQQMKNANKKYRAKKKEEPERVAARESLKAQIERKKEEQSLKMEEQKAQREAKKAEIEARKEKEFLAKCKAKYDAKREAKRDGKKEAITEITEDQYIKAAWEIKHQSLGASMYGFMNKGYDEEKLKEYIKTVTKEQYIEACGRVYAALPSINLMDILYE